MDERKLTYKELSELIGVPLGTLYGLVAQKRIPHIRLGKRFVRFSLYEIEIWLKSNSIKAGDLDEI